MPAPDAPPLPDVRVMDPSFTTYRDYVQANDTGADLLQTANCGWMRRGQAIGARYDLSIVPGSINVGAKTCTLRIRARMTTATNYETTNPVDDQTFTGVLLDGTTAYLGTLVPDVQLVFQDVGVGIVDTHTAHITVGDYLGAFEDGNPSGTVPGEAVYTSRFGLKNFGTGIANDVTVFCDRPRAVHRVRAGAGGFTDVTVTNTSPAAKVVGDQIKPYKITFENLSGGLIDMKVDAALVSTVRRLTNNATSNSTGMHVGESYRIESGGLNGVEVTLDAAIATSDRSNILIWPAVGVEISADNSGSYVAFDTDDVLVGDLAVNGVGYAWIRVFANLGSGSWNPFPCGAGVRWLKTNAAAFDED